MLAAAAAALAAGIRSQVVWLTLPILILGVVRLPRVVKKRGLAGVLLGCAFGVYLWLVPLIIVSGGPERYWRAFVNQGAEDLERRRHACTTHTIRLLVDTLRYAFVAPWGHWQAATAMLALAVLGFFQMLRAARRELITLACAFGPYLVFDLLFQEAITTRYALPLVVPVVFLAVRGLSLIPTTPAMGVALAIVLTSILVDDSVLYVLTDGGPRVPHARRHGRRRDARATPVGRCLRCTGKTSSTCAGPSSGWAMRCRRSPITSRPPPKHEWLELAKYWNGGGRNPVWFVADPQRAQIALVVSRHPCVLSMAAAVSGAPRRRSAQRNGLARRRRAGMVSGRRLVTHTRERPGLRRKIAEVPGTRRSAAGSVGHRAR